jgi:hypothetical protein
MHNLQTERFFKPVMINNMMAVGDGPIKTCALRGTKDKTERYAWRHAGLLGSTNFRSTGATPKMPITTGSFAPTLICLSPDD